MKLTPAFAFAAVLALSACTSSNDSTDSSAKQSAAVETQADPQTQITSPTIGEIPRLHAFGDILLAGQPTAEDFALLQGDGYKTIINLRRPEEDAGFDQPKVLADLGLDYVALPWNGPDQLTDEVFDRVRELLNTSERPLVLHCASANRVGAVWLPWRVLDGGVPFEQALSEAKEIGMRTPDYEVKARDYIQRHSH